MGNKHTMLVQHMKCIQQPELYGGNDERLRAIYCDAHEDVKQRWLFHTQTWAVVQRHQQQWVSSVSVLSS